MQKLTCEDALIDALKMCNCEVVDKILRNDNDRWYLMRNLDDEIIVGIEDKGLCLVYAKCPYAIAYEDIKWIRDMYQGIQICTVCCIIEFHFTVYGISELDSFVSELF